MSLVLMIVGALCIGIGLMAVIIILGGQHLALDGSFRMYGQIAELAGAFVAIISGITFLGFAEVVGLLKEIVENTRGGAQQEDENYEGMA